MAMRKEPDYQEYEQQHVLSLKGVSEWTSAETAIQKQHNRILQTGYSAALSPDEIIQLAKATKMDWLTDFVCPNPAFACKLNIAADLVTSYKVSAEELNDKMQAVFEFVLKNQSNFLPKIEAAVADKLNESAVIATIAEKALKGLKKTYPALAESDPSYQAIKASFNSVEKEIFKKNLIHGMLQEQLKPLYAAAAKELGLELKPVHIKGSNEDFSFLGAAGSGKSTISRKFISDADKKNCIVLATDDYRGVVLDNAHEKLITDQIFTRTQDTAYSIKELIQQRLESRPASRPNIILDCVSLEGWHRKLLSGNKSTISAVACLNDISMVPSRAYLRALDQDSGPADKGRQVNTNALLRGHAEASSRLLSSIPIGVETTLYDTNVERNTAPKLIASIDTRNAKHDITVNNLTRLATFLGKSNVNANAKFKGELYRDDSKKMYRFTYDPPYQAEQVLNLAKAFPPFKAVGFNVTLSTGDKPYAEIKCDSNNKLQLQVLDQAMLLAVLNKGGDEAKVLKNIAMQIQCGSLEEARKNSRELGKGTAEFVAIEQIIPGIQRVPGNIRSAGNLFQQADPVKESNAVHVTTTSTSSIRDILAARKQDAEFKVSTKPVVKAGATIVGLTSATATQPNPSVDDIMKKYLDFITAPTLPSKNIVVEQRPNYVAPSITVPVDNTASKDRDNINVVGIKTR